MPWPLFGHNKEHHRCEWLHSLGLFVRRARPEWWFCTVCNFRREQWSSSGRDSRFLWRLVRLEFCLHVLKWKLDDTSNHISWFLILITARISSICIISLQSIDAERHSASQSLDKQCSMGQISGACELRLGSNSAIPFPEWKPPYRQQLQFNCQLSLPHIQQEHMGPSGPRQPGKLFGRLILPITG